MNVGLDRPAAYVAILESDDFFDPQALELLVSCCRAQTPIPPDSLWLLLIYKPARSCVPAFSVVGNPMVEPHLSLLCPRGRRHRGILPPSPPSVRHLPTHSTGKTASIRRHRVPRQCRDVGFNFKGTGRGQPRLTFICATDRAVLPSGQWGVVRPRSAPRRTACATSTR